MQITNQNWPKDTKPLVSICCITYNHENYIREAIEGFLMQNTTFPVEVLINDDASSDKTAEIVKEYAEKYPTIIYAICQKTNQKTKGVRINPTFNYPRVRGKYIALCEGDDYWTDPYKLQKQVDFLETHNDYIICFHRTKILDEVKSISSVDPKDWIEKRTLTIYDFFKKNYIQTPSLFFRYNGEYLKHFAEWFKEAKIGDWPLILTLALHGKIYYMPDIMAVYRIHRGGIHSSKDKQYYAEAAVSVLESVVHFFPLKYKKIVAKYLDNCYTSLLGYSIKKLNYNKIKLYMSKKKGLYKNRLIFIISFFQDIVILFAKMIVFFKKK